MNNRRIKINTKLKISSFQPLTTSIVGLFFLTIAFCFLYLCIFSTKVPANQVPNYIFGSTLIILFSFAIAAETFTTPAVKMLVFDHGFLLTLYYLPFIKKSYSFKLSAIENLKLIEDNSSDGEPYFKLELSVGKFQKITIFQSNDKEECLEYKNAINLYIRESIEESN